MKDLLPAVGAVNLGCLVQYAVNARQGGNVDHRAPAHALPQAGNYVNRYKVFGNAQVIDGRTAHELGQPRQGANAGRHDGGNHGYQHHRGDEMRQIGNGLYKLHKLHIAHFIEHYGEDHQIGRAQV